LQIFVRDVFLDKHIEEKYLIGKIIREPTYCDTSRRVGGLITSHRYTILSNRFIDFSYFEHGTNWGLCVCKRNSFFKVLDIYKINEKTQISLLHLDENWSLFDNTHSDIEDDIINMSRDRFKNKINYPPIPELATKEWLERLLNPIGIDFNNNYFPLKYNKIEVKNSVVSDQINNMDNAIEKALKFKMEENSKPNNN